MTERRIAPRRRDAGSASIWVLGCAVLLMVVAALGAIRGLAVLARHRAESAADLAALAAAGRIGISADYCSRAAAIARRNGAALSSCSPHVALDGRTGSIVVTVQVHVELPVVGTRTAAASARAGRMPAPVPFAGLANG